MPTDNETPQNLATTIVEITDRATAMLREEIELAKAEVTAKVTKLLKGAVVALAAGLFVVIGLFFLLNGAVWVFYDFVFKNHISYGFFIVAGALFLLGALAGFIAAKAVKAGAPPTPALAMEEARKIKDSVTAAASKDENEEA